MDYSGNILNRIEDAIINTFFWAEELGHRSELFKLDDKNFQGSFKKRIVQRINECLVEDKSITLLSFKIADACKGGNNEIMFLDIVAQNPMTIKMAREYHAHLAMRRIEKELNAAKR